MAKTSHVITFRTDRGLRILSNITIEVTLLATGWRGGVIPENSSSFNIDKDT